MKQPDSVKDIAKYPGRPLAHIDPGDQIPLPPPFDSIEDDPPITPLSDEVREKYEVLDDTIAVNIPRPASKEEEERLVQSFLSGFEKLFTKADNWTFLQPLEMSMEHCAKCQTCSEACHIYEESGGNELYRPIYRSEIMRRIYDQEIAYLDANLATLIADLEERALLDRTILVITSDHGENFGDHGYIEHQLCVYNSLVRVPLIIRFPDLLEPDVVHAPVSTVDLGRAVGALIEIATTAPGQPVSLSLAGFVGGRESHVGEYGNPLRMLRETLGADANRVDLSRFDRRLRFIIHDGLKLIVGSDGRTELYDLANDFDENFDLSSARPDTVGVLEAALAGWDHLLPDQRVASPLPELDDDALRQLESLGYVPPRADD
jgi:hypothetical protein